MWLLSLSLCRRISVYDNFLNDSSSPHPYLQANSAANRLTYNRKVPCSVLEWCNTYTGWGLSWLSSVPPSECRDTVARMSDMRTIYRIFVEKPHGKSGYKKYHNSSNGSVKWNLFCKWFKVLLQVIGLFFIKRNFFCSC